MVEINARTKKKKKHSIQERVVKMLHNKTLSRNKMCKKIHELNTKSLAKCVEKNKNYMYKKRNFL